jgi:hypothetical protein
MAGKERWTEIVQMVTKRAESGKLHSEKESDMYRDEVISRGRFDVSKEKAYVSRFESELARSLPGPGFCKLAKHDRTPPFVR